MKDALINKHIGGLGFSEKSSVEHFLKTGTVNGSFRKALNAMLDEYAEALTVPDLQILSCDPTPTPPSKGRIVWKSQEKSNGLTYSLKKGTFSSYTFDIQYDYYGNTSINPDQCDCYLFIYLDTVKIAIRHGTMEYLMVSAEQYLEQILNPDHGN